MKFKLTLAVLAFVATTLPIQARADGREGHGGKVVACFSIPVAEAVKDGMLTEAGRAAITSVDLLEYWTSTVPTMEFNNLRDEMMALPAGSDTSAMRLLDLFRQVPDFYEELLEVYSHLGGFGPKKFYNQGIPSIDDAGVMPGFKSGCAPVQAAKRLRERVTYDQTLWEKADALQQGLLVVHEVLYEIAVRRGHTDSLAVQALIQYLLEEGWKGPGYSGSRVDGFMADIQISNRLRDLGFGEYRTLEASFGYYYMADELDQKLLWFAEALGPLVQKCDVAKARKIIKGSQEGWRLLTGLESESGFSKSKYPALAGKFDSIRDHIFRDVRDCDDLHAAFGNTLFVRSERPYWATATAEREARWTRVGELRAIVGTPR